MPHLTEVCHSWVKLKSALTDTPVFLSTVFSRQSRFFPFLKKCLWPHLWHMAAPGLGVESELQLPVYATATARPDPGCICDLCCPLWLCAIKAGIEPESSWTLCWVLNLMSHNRNCNLGFFFFFFFFFLFFFF